MLSTPDYHITRAGLLPGTRLTIQVPSKTEGDREITVFSTYEAAVANDAFMITAPMLGSEIYPLHKGEKVRVAYVTAQAFFETDAIVMERYRKQGLEYIKMQCASFVKRNQRRNDFRVDVSLECGLTRCKDGDPSKPMDEYIKCLINNISAGGAAVLINTELEIGSVAIIGLPPEVFGSHKELLCQVHWRRRPENDAIYKFYSGMRFLFENTRDKEQLVKFALDCQRKLRKKENG